jgi:ribosomal protein S6--L-glutamate ligase
MKKLIIVTAEPNNFVPIELKKAAEKVGVGLETQILDITKCVLIEGAESGVFFINDGILVPVNVDAETAIIPRLNEYHLEIKLGILKRLETQGAKLLNTPESMELCNDKLMTQVVLNSAEIKTPYSVIIQGTDDIETVVTSLEQQGKINYPFVIKTLRGTHGIGVMKVDSRASLVSVAQTLSKEGIDFMLQEFCKHDKSIRVIMIGNSLLASNLRGQPKEKDEFRTNSHLGSETEKYEPSEEELAVSKKIVELFGSRFCAIDYLLTENKEIIVLEVNGSPGLENIQKNWPEKNLAEEIVKYLNQSHADVEQPIAPTSEISAMSPTATDPVAQTTEPDDHHLGETEPCTVHRIIDNTEARIDTGAKYSSLHVDKSVIEGDFVKFTRGDITYKVPVYKTVKIRQASLDQSISRPVVKLDITVRGIRLNQIEFTLNDRSTMKYEILLGRNVLGALGIPITFDSNGYSSESPESEIIDSEEE